MNKSNLSILVGLMGLSLIKSQTKGSSAINLSKLDKYVDIDFYFIGKCTIYSTIIRRVMMDALLERGEFNPPILEQANKVKESFIKQMDTSIFDILLYASQKWRYIGHSKLSSMYPVPSLNANEVFEMYMGGFEFPAIETLIDYWRNNFEDEFEYLEDVEDFSAFGGYGDGSLFEALEYFSTIFISFDSYKLEIDEGILEPEHIDHLQNGYIIQYVPFKLKCRFLLNQDPNDIADAMIFFLSQIARCEFADGIDAEVDIDVGFKYIIDPSNKLSNESKSLIFGNKSELRRF